MSRVRRSRVASVTVAAVVALLLVGCSAATDSSPEPTAGPSEAVDDGTLLEELDTTSLVVARAPFCDVIDPAAVTRALDIGPGEEPADGSAYRSGQRINLSDGAKGGVADVVHEFGCRWTAGDAVAEAWVFVPPVTRERAADLVRTGCQGIDAAAFGEPTATCRTRADGVETVTVRGLFGDAWLTCRLTLATGESDALDRAGRWCAAVATGASSG